MTHTFLYIVKYTYTCKCAYINNIKNILFTYVHFTSDKKVHC